jgi:hypothetical protein
VSGEATTTEAGRQALPVMIVGDESGLRWLAELLAPYMPALAASSEPDRWLTTREAAEYAGTTTNALHKAMAALEIHFEQDTPGGKGWFKRRTSTPGEAESARAV